jgi:hypothetical protein
MEQETMTRTTPTPEGKVKAKLKKLLTRPHVFFFSPVASAMGKAGIPDTVVCVHTHFLGIEVKATAADKPSPLQKRRAREIRAAGGEVLLLHADNLHIFADWLNDEHPAQPKHWRKLDPLRLEA